MRILCIFSFLSFIDTLFLYIRSYNHVYFHTLYLSSIICGCMFFFHLPLHVLVLFSLYTHVSYTCMQFIISVSHKNALMSFV